MSTVPTVLDRTLPGWAESPVAESRPEVAHSEVDRGMRMKRWCVLLVIIGVLAGWLGAAPAAAEAPTSVTLVGDLQTELGCAADWDPTCPRTELRPTGEPGRWAGEFTLPAGSYEYKVAIDHGWEITYGLNGGPQNAPLAVAGELRLLIS